MGACSVSGCDRPVIARGWCGAHYRRWRKYGNVHHGPPLAPAGRGTCRIEGCAEPAWNESLCTPHYERLRRYGDPLAGRSIYGTGRQFCRVEGCERHRVAYGYCEAHYRRLQNHGDPLAGRRRAPASMSTEERFWLYVDRRSDHECWPWKAGTNPKGYGVFQVGRGKSQAAHRFAYELAHGAVPEGQQVHHACERRDCQNPAHLKALPPGMHALIGNGFSGRNAKKTHCKRGHELTPENCYDYAGRRVCKLCARIRARKNRV